LRFSPIRLSRCLLSSALCSLFASVGLFGTVSHASAQVSVLTQHNDNARTGANLNETILNTTNVNVTRFGKLFARDVDGEVYAQPLYVPNLTIPGKGVHNVIFVATMNNSLYAFNADDPAQSTPLWVKNYGAPVPVSDVQSISDISVKVGILSTPVIDPATSTMYVVHRNKDGTNFRQYLHAIDIATGNERANSPVEITGTSGSWTFNARRQNQRPALTLANGKIYIAWASHNDIGPYNGWVMAYDKTTLQRLHMFLAAPDGSMAGIWQSGQGLTVDSSGNLYFMTGNGTFNRNTGGQSLGCSVIKLSPTLQLLSWFTPFDVNDLNARDDDLGSAGILDLPGTNHVLGGGKDGRLFLMNRDSLGGFTPGSNNVAQSFRAFNGHLHGTPIYYNGPNGPCIYLWAEFDNLKVYKYAGGLLQTTPMAQSTMRVADGMPGAFLSLSANGTTPGTALIWASSPLSENANNAVVEGIFRVFDANTVVVDGNGVPRLRELWNSKQNAARDNIGKFAKFVPPTVANGKVYMASFGTNASQIGSSGQIVVYGLLANPGAPGAPANLRASAGDRRIGLQWDVSPGADTYNVKRSLKPTGGYKTIATGVQKTAFTDTFVSNGVTYYYVVSAVNPAGESPNSERVAATPQTKGASVALAPLADTYVRSGDGANTNYGGSTQLIVKVDPPNLTRWTYFKFDLSEIKKVPTSVKLRVYGAREGTNSASQDSVYAVANTTWTENGMTWNNKPALGAKLSTATVRSQPAYYEWDVTSHVRSEFLAGRKTVALAITMDVLPADGLRDNFHSKEAGSNPPQLVVSSSGDVATIDFGGGFGNAQGMTLNGSAAWSGTRLRLTNGGGSQAGSAFYNTPVNVQSFRTTFTFQLTQPNADGITFTIQNNQPTALGGTGGGLGFGPDPGGDPSSIPNSVCVKFDLYSNNGEGVNSTGVFTNGVPPFTPAVDLTGTGIDLHSGNVFRVTMTYNGTQLAVSITDTVTGVTATNTYPINIPATIGGTTGLVGFTGGTGGLTAIQDIVTWTYGNL
jgi:hypothetical protein